jgi:hypothetical protein
MYTILIITSKIRNKSNVNKTSKMPHSYGFKSNVIFALYAANQWSAKIGLPLSKCRMVGITLLLSLTI